MGIMGTMVTTVVALIDSLSMPAASQAVRQSVSQAGSQEVSQAAQQSVSMPALTATKPLGCQLPRPGSLGSAGPRVHTRITPALSLNACCGDVLETKVISRST